jgi:hypothetical protein
MPTLALIPYGHVAARRPFRRAALGINLTFYVFYGFEGGRQSARHS